MARLIYTSITSLDGYVADAEGNFDWSAPDEEVHAFVNELERPIGTYLYGRRLYEVMRVWDTLELDGEPPVMHDFASMWRAAEKVVFSATLGDASTARTRIEREFDPQAIERLKQSSSSDLSVGGPTLAAAAIRAGIVDEFQQFVTPVIVGGGTRFLPDGVFAHLDLLDLHRFANGVVYLRYRPR